MPGWGRRAAQDVVAETGADMTRFPTPGHLASWAGRTPLDSQSGSRAGRARHRHGNRYVAAVTGETAVAAGKTQTREGARHRRLVRRRGKAKACVATGNTQMRVYHVLLSNPGMRYEDLGWDYYERERNTARQVSHHIGKLAGLGYEVTLCKLPDPDPGPAEDTPASLTRAAPSADGANRRRLLPRARLSTLFRVSSVGINRANRTRKWSEVMGRWLARPKLMGSRRGEAGRAVSPGTGGLAGRPRRACPSSPGRFPSPSPRKARRSSPGRGRIPRPGPGAGPLACRAPGGGCPRPPP